MVVISAGMVKSGSLWYYRLIDELLVASGEKADLLAPPHTPIEAFHKGDKIKCSGLTFSNLSKLSRSARKGYSYPVKTHSAPTLSLPFFGSALKTVKIAYTYRDPRDVVLSVLDHGEKARRENLQINLRDIRSFAEAVAFVEVELKKWKRWKRYQTVFEVLTVRYEDLVRDPMSEVNRLTDFLNLKVPLQEKEVIISKYDKNNYKKRDNITNNIHVNKARTKRYEREMSAQELSYCESKFSPYLREMEYVLAETATP